MRRQKDDNYVVVNFPAKKTISLRKTRIPEQINTSLADENMLVIKRLSTFLNKDIFEISGIYLYSDISSIFQTWYIPLLLSRITETCISYTFQTLHIHMFVSLILSKHSIYMYFSLLCFSRNISFIFLCHVLTFSHSI